MKKIKIALGTLGCKLNKFESDSLISDFIDHNYEIVSFHEKADVYIVNTCTVTNKSDAKSRNIINRVKKLNSRALLFVTGCYAETDRLVIETMPGVDYVIGNDKKYDLFNIVHKILKKQSFNIDDIQEDRFHYKPAKNTLHTRSFLKIQDGCNQHCSYCKIPIARGKAQSRPVNDIIDTIQDLLQFGYKEIILTGINIGDYQYQHQNLTDIINLIINLSGDFRIHLSSIEPNQITPQLIDVLSHRKICRHLHIPLQSGNNRILQLMRRNYTREDYKDIIRQIRQSNSSINISTDVMVGFPGENEEEFKQTYQLIKELELTHTHTFKYSIREGTPAATMKEQIHEKIKSARSKKIRQLSEELNQLYRKKFLNTKVRVLTEKEIGKYLYTGYTDHYIRVQFENTTAIIGDFREILIQDVSNEVVVAKIVT